MKPAKCFCRLAGLAVALGIGGWLASVPWMAGADSDTSALGLIDPVGLDLVAPAAGDPAWLDIDVSYNGTDLFHIGNGATAISGSQDLAIAYGPGSTADANGGSFDFAIAGNGGTAYSGMAVVPGNGTSGGGSEDLAIAYGPGSTAEALDKFDVATASGGGTAYSGFFYDPQTIFAGGGIGDWASANGAGSTAQGGAGYCDFASASGADSTATAAFGNHDIADVLGEQSTAVAGSSPQFLHGDFDFAGAFGNDLSALASPGSNLFVVEPDVFGASAAGAALPVDDLGASDLLSGATGWLDGLLSL